MKYLKRIVRLVTYPVTMIISAVFFVYLSFTSKLDDEPIIPKITIDF